MAKKLKCRKATLPWLTSSDLRCLALLVLHRSTSHRSTDRDARYKEELQRLPRELSPDAQITGPRQHATTAAGASPQPRPSSTVPGQRTTETTTTKKLWLAVGLPHGPAPE